MSETPVKKRPDSGPGEPDGGGAPSDPNNSGHGKDGCDPTTSAKLALQLRATQLGHAQLGGPQAGGPHLDVGLIG